MSCVPLHVQIEVITTALNRYKLLLHGLKLLDYNHTSQGKRKKKNTNKEILSQLTLATVYIHGGSYLSLLATSRSTSSLKQLINPSLNILDSVLNKSFWVLADIGRILEFHNEVSISWQQKFGNSYL